MKYFKLIALGLIMLSFKTFGMQQETPMYRNIIIRTNQVSATLPNDDIVIINRNVEDPKNETYEGIIRKHQPLTRIQKQQALTGIPQVNASAPIKLTPVEAQNEYFGIIAAAKEKSKSAQ